jgi:hypothetical protein
MSKAINEFQEELIKKAISLIDTDELAEKLAGQIQSRLEHDAKDIFDNDIYLRDWLQDAITDESSPVGKAFDKAVSKIANKMVKAIN